MIPIQQLITRSCMNKLILSCFLVACIFGCSKDIDKPKADRSIGLNEEPSKIEDPNYTDDFRKNLNANNKPKSSYSADKGSHQENGSDKTITINARHALLIDDQLTTKGKNIKILSSDGVVTLRGPVETEAEKSAIEEKIKNIEGVQKIDNQLDVEESEVKN